MIRKIIMLMPTLPPPLTPTPPPDSEALNEEGGTMVVFGWVPANDGSKGLKGQDEFLI